jgi:hypothetical protein
MKLDCPHGKDLRYEARKRIKRCDSELGTCILFYKPEI